MRLPIAVQAKLDAADRDYRSLLARLGLDGPGLDRLVKRIRKDPRRPGSRVRAAAHRRGGLHV